VYSLLACPGQLPVLPTQLLDFLFKIFRFARFLVVCFSIMSTVLSLKSNDSKLTEMERMKQRSSFNMLHRSPNTHAHEVVFALKQNNLDVIEREVLERATPGNPKYQQWMSFDEIGTLIKNDAAMSYLTTMLRSDPTIHITWKSRRGEYVKAVAPIASWEILLSTQFYEWRDDHNNVNVHRCRTYFLPEEATAHIDAIFHTSQALPAISQHYLRKMRSDIPRPEALKDSVNSQPYKTVMTIHDPTHSVLRGSINPSTDHMDVEATNVVTVSFLDSYYGISSNKASSSQEMSVFETSGQSMSQSDLTQFQATYNLTVQAAVLETGSGAISHCTDTLCGEGNLDIQYIMGIAQKAVGIYWFVLLCVSVLLCDIKRRSCPGAGSSHPPIHMSLG
jgi:hypothetical protein